MQLFWFIVPSLELPNFVLSDSFTGVNAYNATSGSVNITARNATCGWNNQEDRFIALNVDSAAWVEGKITVIVKNAACASQVPSSPRITA